MGPRKHKKMEGASEPALGFDRAHFPTACPLGPLGAVLAILRVFHQDDDIVLRVPADRMLGDLNQSINSSKFGSAPARR